MHAQARQAPRGRAAGGAAAFAVAQRAGGRAGSAPRPAPKVAAAGTQVLGPLAAVDPEVAAKRAGLRLMTFSAQPYTNK